jgi:hypothetical protein
MVGYMIMHLIHFCPHIVASLQLVMSMSPPESNDDDNVLVYLANETKMDIDYLDYIPGRFL